MDPFVSINVSSRLTDHYLSAYTDEYYRHFGSLTPFYWQLNKFQNKVYKEEKKTRIKQTYFDVWKDGNWQQVSKNPEFEWSNLVDN